MSDDEKRPEPWAEVVLPGNFDAREIYEYAKSVGAERRRQRRRSQILLTVCSCLVVLLTAAGISFSLGDSGHPNVQLTSEPSRPLSTVPSESTVPDSTTLPIQAEPPPPTPTRPVLPTNPSTASRCGAFAPTMASFRIKLTAFHTQQVTTTSTPTATTIPATTTTTTTTTRPPPPPTTLPTRRTTPSTRIAASPGTVFVPPTVDPGNGRRPPESQSTGSSSRC